MLTQCNTLSLIIPTRHSWQWKQGIYDSIPKNYLRWIYVNKKLPNSDFLYYLRSF